MKRKKNEKESRSERIHFRVTTKERAEIVAAAKESNLDVSEYLRQKILGRDKNEIRLRPIVPPASRRAYLELGKLLERTYDFRSSSEVLQLSQQLEKVMLILTGVGDELR